MKPKEQNLIAVAGQPNSGKSTLFNMLCGTRQFIANYPGVTVEKKSGYFQEGSRKFELVDLPGTYSLTSYSLEERVSRDFLLHERPSAVLDILDASNLKQNLYLALQLLEMGAPMVLALNKMDVAKKRGLEIDTEKIGERLNARVVPTIARTGQGRQEIRQEILDISQSGSVWQPLGIDYAEMEPYLNKIQARLSEYTHLYYPARWLAVKLMERDSQAESLISQQITESSELLGTVQEQRELFEEKQQVQAERFIATKRHLLARNIYQECVQTSSTSAKTLSDKIDSIVCNRYLGPIILVAVIFIIYQLAIGQGYNLTNYFLPLLNKARDGFAALLPEKGFVFDPYLRPFVLWVVDGVKAVLNYIPIFVILFALIAIMEHTGYLARITFLLDRILRKFGLHGQSVLPMVLGGLVCGG